MLEEVNLTVGEKLCVLRRREGVSQGEMARRHGVSRSTYIKWETDQSKPNFAVEIRGLRGHERCRVARLRAEKTQAEVADELEVSRHTVGAMERGLVDCEKLLWFWDH